MLQTSSHNHGMIDKFLKNLSPDTYVHPLLEAPFPYFVWRNTAISKEGTGSLRNSPNRKEGLHYETSQVSQDIMIDSNPNPLDIGKLIFTIYHSDLIMPHKKLNSVTKY